MPGFFEEIFECFHFFEISLYFAAKVCFLQGEFMSKSKPNEALCSLHRMVRHIRVLGTLRGLKYWRIENACRRDPEMVIRWAVRCEREANRCNLRGDKHGEAMMTGWAGELRASHRRYVTNSK